jgi:hypothetical protein
MWVEGESYSCVDVCQGSHWKCEWIWLSALLDFLKKKQDLMYMQIPIQNTLILPISLHMNDLDKGLPRIKGSSLQNIH